MNKYEVYLNRKIVFALEIREKYISDYRLSLYHEIMGAIHFCSVMGLIDDDSFDCLTKKAIEIL